MSGGGEGRGEAEERGRMGQVSGAWNENRIKEGWDGGGWLDVDGGGEWVGE